MLLFDSELYQQKHHNQETEFALATQNWGHKVGTVTYLRSVWGQTLTVWRQTLHSLHGLGTDTTLILPAQSNGNHFVEIAKINAMVIAFFFFVR